MAVNRMWIERLVDRRANIQIKLKHPADVLATWADIGKAERIFGWWPETRFENGVEKLVE